MKQISFAQAEYQNKKKVTRRERFLTQMEALVPWQRLIDALSPSYFPNATGKRGRPPIGLERMLRIYFLQQWYALADEALEDAIYDSQAMRDFVGVDLTIESVPDATTLLRFRHLLEKHALTQRIFEEINAHLAEKGLFMREGTIVDATIVAAAPSIKNKIKQRDPEMKQTKKGNQWYFGMKAHIGVDAVTGLTHSVAATSANVADVTMAGALVREDDKRVYGDAGYTGMWKHLDEEKDAPDSKCCVAAKRGASRRWTAAHENAAAGIRKGQGQHPCQGRAPVSCHQEPLRLPQNALQGAGQEPGATLQPVRAGQPGAGDTMRGPS